MTARISPDRTAPSLNVSVTMQPSIWSPATPTPPSVSMSHSNRSPGSKLENEKATSRLSAPTVPVVLQPVCAVESQPAGGVPANTSPTVTSVPRRQVPAQPAIVLLPPSNRSAIPVWSESNTMPAWPGFELPFQLKRTVVIDADSAVLTTDQNPEVVSELNVFGPRVSTIARTGRLPTTISPRFDVTAPRLV